MGILTANPVQASQATVGLSFATFTHEGLGTMGGELHGLRVHGADEASKVSGYAGAVHLVTWNYTSRPVLGAVATNPQNGGLDRNYAHAFIEGTLPRAAVDVLIVPLRNGAFPKAMTNGSLVDVQRASGVLEEVGYVEQDRPTLSQSLAHSLAARIEQGTIRVDGDFEVSVWNWDFQIGADHIQTGPHRTNATRDPVTGQEIVADVAEQVARLTITGGWMEFGGITGADLYGDVIHLDLNGRTTLQGVSGTLNTKHKPELTASTLTLQGNSVIEAARASEAAFVDILHSDHATLDGQAVKILDKSPGPRPGSVVEVRTPGGGPRILPIGASVAGLLLVAVVLHGPMQGFRFRRIQQRFEDRDYLEVLTHIDPFTRRRAFRRKAAFLKAVSLLSLESYREASLYLDTLEPGDGPEPATHAFLRACAAAGQGHDAAAIEHLGVCLRLDPSYHEEAQSLPILAGALAYFRVTGGNPSA